MRQVGGGPHDGSLTDFARFISYDDARLSRKDQIKFVGTTMGVDPLKLSGLEAVEPHEQVMPREEIGFGRLVGGEGDCGVD
jgi:hypothetical protein